MKSCIVCDKELKFDEHFVYDATLWRTTGNYGSTVYDESGNVYLEACICDDCLKRKKAQVEEVRWREKRCEIVSRKQFELDNIDWRKDEADLLS